MPAAAEPWLRQHLCVLPLVIMPRECSCHLNTTRVPADLLPNFIMQQACNRRCGPTGSPCCA